MESNRIDMKQVREIGAIDLQWTSRRARGRKRMIQSGKFDVAVIGESSAMIFKREENDVPILAICNRSERRTSNTHL